MARDSHRHFRSTPQVGAFQLLVAGGVGTPAVEAGGEVGWQGALEMEVLAGSRMLEAENAGVESLAREHLEAVLHKLTVTAEGGALEDGVATVGGVAEEGMPYVAHVGAYLVGSACLEDTLDEGDIAEALQHMPVGDGMLAMFVVADVHGAAVAWRPC